MRSSHMRQVRYVPVFAHGIFNARSLASPADWRSLLCSPSLLSDLLESVKVFQEPIKHLTFCACPIGATGPRSAFPPFPSPRWGLWLLLPPLRDIQDDEQDHESHGDSPEPL